MSFGKLAKMAASRKAMLMALQPGDWTVIPGKAGQTMQSLQATVAADIHRLEGRIPQDFSQQGGHLWYDTSQSPIPCTIVTRK